MTLRGKSLGNKKKEQKYVEGWRNEDKEEEREGNISEAGEKKGGKGEEKGYRRDNKKVK